MGRTPRFLTMHPTTKLSALLFLTLPLACAPRTTAGYAPAPAAHGAWAAPPPAMGAGAPTPLASEGASPTPQGPRGGVTKIAPDARGAALVDALLRALATADENARLAAVLPLVHPSLRSEDGRDLSRNVKPFSYRKASDNVRFYAVPVVLTEVHLGEALQLGIGAQGEPGRIDKYFVAKLPGVPGLPAPIHVFFPASGAPPTIVNMGSL